jgi:hypothetical protein
MNTVDHGNILSNIESICNIGNNAFIVLIFSKGAGKLEKLKPSKAPSDCGQ